MAIAHNGNISNGMMFPNETVDGKPLTRKYAESGFSIFSRQRLAVDCFIWEHHAVRDIAVVSNSHNFTARLFFVSVQCRP